MPEPEGIADLLGGCPSCGVVGTEVLLSALRCTRRYRSGDAFGVASKFVNDKSGTDVDRLIVESGRLSSAVLLSCSSEDLGRCCAKTAVSSLDPFCGTIERLDEPDDETVESEEEDACVG